MTTKRPGVVDAFTRDEVVGLERRRTRAMVTRDLASLRQLVSQDCAYIHSTGSCESGSSYLLKLSGGTFGYERIDIEEVMVTIKGATAVVVYLQEAAMAIGDDRHTAITRCTAIWVRHAGQTRLVAFQATPLA